MFAIITLLKILGIIEIFKWPIPGRFPPENTFLKSGDAIYLFLEKIIFFLNINIRIFPSGLVVFFQKESVKLLFLRFPFLFFDLLVIVLLFISFKKKNKILFLIFGLINFWFLFFFKLERIDLCQKINWFFLKPYKISDGEKVFYSIFLIIAFLLLISLFNNKKNRGLFLTFIVFFKKLLISKKFLLLLFIFIVIWQSGFLLKFNDFQGKWKGYWIWADGWRNKENAHITFKKDFILLFKPREAFVYSHCESEYLLWVNNKFIGRGGLESPEKVLYYDSFPVERYLNIGKNSVKIECRNQYLSTFSMVKREGGMIFQLEARKGLLKKRIVSGKDWQSLVDKRYVFETYRVHKLVGFQQIYANDNNFLSVKTKVIDTPKDYFSGSYEKRPIPFLSQFTVYPKEIITVGKFKENPKVKTDDLAFLIGEGIKEVNYGGENVADKNFKEKKLVLNNQDFILLDFGKIVVGYPMIKGNFSKGTVLNFGFAEILRPDRTPDVAKMVSQADTIIISEESLDYEWFERRAFRYAFIYGKNISHKANLIDFMVNSVNYPADDRESEFASSDILLNKIFEISKYTAKIARQEIFEDCPHREKAQYVGDMRIVSLVNYFNYSDKRLIKKALWEFALSQDKDGDISAVYPAGDKLKFPDYAAQWISVTWEYYLYSGDSDFLKKIFPYLQKQLQYFQKFADKDGLIRRQNNWSIFIDHGEQELNNDKSISFNLIYLETLRNYAKICSELSLNDEAEKYLSLSNKMVNSINSLAFVGNKYLYDDCLIGQSKCGHFSRQTNTLALREKIISKSKEKALVNELLNNNILPQVITPYFNFFVADGLFSKNYDKEAVDLIKNYWGAMVKKDAQTFWETYDPKTGRETPSFGESLSHGWSSGPAYLLPRWILGVNPLLPGFSRFEVKPNFESGLRYASGTVPVSSGHYIKVSWTKDKEYKLILNYNFPSIAEVILPMNKGMKIYINGSEKKPEIKENNYTIALEKAGVYEILIK